MNEKRNDGGRAFPSTKPLDPYGMSLRDWFAGKAMVVMLSMQPQTESDAIHLIPPAAYRIADAMLLERSK